MKKIGIGILLISVCVCLFYLSSLYRPSTQIEKLETERKSQQTKKQDLELMEDTKKQNKQLQIQIEDTVLTAVWENNEAAQTLQTWLEEGPITISVQNYGNFEKVGKLPQALPQEDQYVEAKTKDIMLYQGDSIVFFYGSNAWSYTKLATIINIEDDALSKLLSGNATTIRLMLVDPINEK